MLSDRVSEPVPTATQAAEIVGYSGGSLLIRGPAGSGKTRLIIDRFAWLVQQGAAPERLAVLVPSAARAGALRGALEQRLDGGYSELLVLTAPQLAAAVLRRHPGGWHERPEITLSQGDRLAMLAERIDELPLQHHDFGGNSGVLLASLVRRIDRLKAELVDSGRFSEWARQVGGPREREFAEIFAAHERMVRETGGCDDNDLIRLATRLAEDQAPERSPFAALLIDDAQELDLAAATLARALAPEALTVAGDPMAGALRFRGAGAQRLEWFQQADMRVVTLAGSRRCPPPIMAAARAVAAGAVVAGEDQQAAEAVSFWRCASDRAQAQGVAADIERLIVRDRVAPGAIVVLVADLSGEGVAVAAALEERAVPQQLVGEVGLFQRAEVRDLLAWLRLLADPGDAPAVVRALARAPIELRSADIARCTQIARRRKLDMVAALTAAIESPQVPPEARERIRVFLKLYRAGAAHIDTMRPDLYVHRLVDRLGLRRQHLFAAQADVVARLRALARFGELAAAHVARSPQATARDFARSVATLAEWGFGERDEPLLAGAGVVQVLEIGQAGGLEADHVYVLGLAGTLAHAPWLHSEPVPDQLLAEPLPADDDAGRRTRLRQRLYLAISRARRSVVLAHAAAGAAGAPALAEIECARRSLGAEWSEIAEEQSGPADTLQATYRLLRDELMEDTARAAARLAELRLDTDLDVSHAVVRYLELLKVAALLARAEGDPDHGLAEALRDINARIEQAVTAEEREIFASSPIDEYLLDGERDVRRRARALAAREEPSLARFLPLSGDGVMLSATDIDTYRACPLRYKFARVFRIPREPSLHQRFGITVHQVLERFHAHGTEQLGPLAELHTLLDRAWQRGGFGDSGEERQLYAKAVAALARYHERASSDPGHPVWFERQFSFRLGEHLVRGRVDRVNRLDSGEYELVDYKTGRPRSAEQLAGDVQLSLYALAAREAWGLQETRGVYHYLLDDERVAVAAGPGRVEWVRGVALEVAAGIMAQEFEPAPSARVCRLCDYRLACPAAER